MAFARVHFVLTSLMFMKLMKDNSDRGTEHCIKPLLSQNSYSRKKLVRKKSFLYKVIFLILLWTFCTGLLYNLFLKPFSFVQNIDTYVSLVVYTVSSSAIYLLSPLVGFIADVIFGRLKVLLCGTFMMLLSVCSILIVVSCLSSTLYSFNSTGKTILAVLGTSFILYGSGATLFLSNIVQFGTDQLRDAPTRYSVYFICAYYWTDSFGQLLTAATNIPGHEITITKNENIIAVDKLRGYLIVAVLGLSISLTCTVICVLHKRKSKWFMFEKCTNNPYTLIIKVVSFAIKHKKPIRRSAFTFCENERPSRLDFGKQRYGGPYTTEHVEDVKVMINMFKIILTIGPVFTLEVAACISFLWHRINYTKEHKVVDQVGDIFFGHGLIVPLCKVLCIPVWQCMFKPLLSRYFPNMFKRIGIALSFLTTSFIVYFVCDIVDYNNNGDVTYYYNACLRNVSYVLNHNYIAVPSMYVSILQQLIYGWSQILLYISAYEYICCQSPQYMKGLLFGLFYATRAFYQFVAATVLLIVIRKWNSTIMSCRSGYYLFNILIGVMTLIVYTVAAKRYKYRKRDDICHVYKYAEDYYSNIQ